MISRVALVLAALALGVGWQGDAELLELRRAFRPARDPSAVHERRAAAIEAVTRDPLPAVARELIDAYLQLEKEAEKPAERHRAALTKKQRYSAAELRPDLDGLRILQDRMLDVLAALQDPAAIEYALGRALEEERQPMTLRLAIAPLAGVLGEPALEPLAEALSARREPATLTVALVGAGALGPRGAPLGEPIIEALEHGDPTVREAAAAALAQLALPSSIAPLVARLEEEDGRTQRCMAEALQVITRRHMGAAPEAWRAWLEREGAPYVAGEVALGGGESFFDRPSGARYHGIAVEGESVLFVLDRSRSMNKRMQAPPMGGGASRPTIKELRSDRARSELIAALEDLSPEQTFGVIAFAGGMERFEDDLVPATPKNVAAARKWVEGLTLDLGTNIYAALELAFHVAGRGTEDAFYETRVDTIFLLTDGRPYIERGADDPERILAGLRRWNLMKRVKVHAIGLGDDVPMHFMRGIAHENGGRFVLESLEGGVDVSTRPNLLVFLVDDMGWRDPGFAGGVAAETPAMDRLAREGMTFASAYVNGPNCSPSRASLMTGLYTPRHGIYTVKEPDRGPAWQRRLVPIANNTVLAGEHLTLAEALRDDGYATAIVGKWHLGGDPTEHGFDLAVGAGLRDVHSSYFGPWELPSLPGGSGDEYLTDRLTDEALAFLRAERDAPFFLFFSHYGVHAPYEAPADLVAKYEELGLEDRRAKYAAMVETVDTSLGRVLDELEAEDLADNTLVVFLSDNGGRTTVTTLEPLRGAKGTPYEGAFRVPLAARWPGRVRPGAVEQRPVIGMDLFPTLLDAAGVDHAPVDGESLLPLLLDTGGLDRTALFWHFPAYLEAHGSGDADLFRARPFGAVRSGPWKLIEHFEDGQLELYNLRQDPGEAEDLAASKPERRDELHALLVEWRSEVGAPVPTELEPEFGKEPEKNGR